MRKFILIEVIDREITAPDFFDTHEAAFDEMCRRLAEVYGETLETTKKDYANGTFGESLTENEAWVERHGQYFDYGIFEVG